MEFIDTHAHLYAEQFAEDLDLVVKKAKEERVSMVLLPNVDEHSSELLIQLYESDSSFFKPMMGLHPCSVSENYIASLDQISAHFLRHNFVSVGEIGLDYYWDTSKKKQQLDAFRVQIAWAKEKNLPIAIHCRDAFDDILTVLEKEQDGSLKGVLHCFSGNAAQAKQIMDLGLYLGIGGVLTFKNSGLDKAIENFGLEKLVLETDAPYLAPVPFRGKRNESAYLIYVAQKLTDVFSCKMEEVSLKTSQNAKNLFNI